MDYKCGREDELDSADVGDRGHLEAGVDRASQFVVMKRAQPAGEGTDLRIEIETKVARTAP